jgi:hypothetical protein
MYVCVLPEACSTHESSIIVVDSIATSTPVTNTPATNTHDVLIMLAGKDLVLLVLAALIHCVSLRGNNGKIQ